MNTKDKSIQCGAHKKKTVTQLIYYPLPNLCDSQGHVCSATYHVSSVKLYPLTVLSTGPPDKTGHLYYGSVILFWYIFSCQGNMGLLQAQCFFTWPADAALKASLWHMLPRGLLCHRWLCCCFYLFIIIIHDDAGSTYPLLCLWWIWSFLKMCSRQFLCLLDWHLEITLADGVHPLAHSNAEGGWGAENDRGHRDRQSDEEKMGEQRI